VKKQLSKDFTPRRTRSHVIAALSVNDVTRYFIVAGHVPAVVSEDYGYDVTVITHDRRGNAEGGILYLQLKASERLPLARGKQSYPFAISRRHFNLWKNELMPVFLICYAADTGMAFWLHLQRYFQAHPSLFSNARQSARIFVPAANLLDRDAVEFMVDIKREAVHEAAKIANRPK
jgi:hypothetical protein